jgi:Asp-tRNA(Asn)/Glu-tRNA(Gln) amidotransferase A subunit family amidase
MANAADILDLPLARAAERVRAGHVTSVQLTEAAIARAEATQRLGNAFVEIFADRALAQAEMARCTASRWPIRIAWSASASRCASAPL